MNVRVFVASPPDKGKDPADFAPETISNNKPDNNALMNNARSFIFYGHDGLFLTNPGLHLFVINHGFGKRPTR
jgi:hypothetical protein